MSRLAVLLVIMSSLAVSHVSCLAKHCEFASDCRSEGKATTCSEGLCLQPCVFNRECASGDCEHEGIRINGFCEVEQGRECRISLSCPREKKCKHGYCVPI